MVRRIQITVVVSNVLNCVSTAFTFRRLRPFREARLARWALKRRLEEVDEKTVGASRIHAQHGAKAIAPRNMLHRPQGVALTRARSGTVASFGIFGLSNTATGPCPSCGETVGRATSVDHLFSCPALEPLRRDLNVSASDLFGEGERTTICARYLHTVDRLLRLALASQAAPLVDGEPHAAAIIAPAGQQQQAVQIGFAHQPP
jgi:hypothetical protein